MYLSKTFHALAVLFMVAALAVVPLGARGAQAALITDGGGGHASGNAVTNINPNASPNACTTPTATSPVNQSVSAGSSAGFSTSASSYTSIQWQVSTNGNSWSNLTDGANVSGSTTTTLTLSNTTTGMSGNQYRAHLTNNNIPSGCNPSTSTDTTGATLTVTAASCATPSFGTQPTNQSVTTGDTATFTVAGSNYTGIQWQVSSNGNSWSNLSNGANVSGATTISLSLSNTTTNMSGNQYRAVLTNSPGGCTASTGNSNAATLTVASETLTIAFDHSSYSCSIGVSCAVSGTLSSSGGSISNCNPYSVTITWDTGVTTSPNPTASGGVCIFSSSHTYSALSTYDVTAVGHKGNTDSNTAHTSITTNPVPPSVTTNPSNATVCAGGTASFTAAATGNPQPTVGWFANFTTSLGAGTVTHPTSTSTSSTLSFTAQTSDNGTVYGATFSNSGGDQGTSSAILTVNTAPGITAQPQDRSVGIGHSASFSVTATGTSPTYQWQVSTNGNSWSDLSNGGDVSGATTETLTVANTTLAMSGNEYRAIVSGACPPSTKSSAATLTVTAVVTLSGHSFTCSTGATCSLIIPFTDDDNDICASFNYTATINWGDGTIDVGTIGGISGLGGGCTVSGSHTYPFAGDYNVTVTVNDLQDIQTRTLTVTANVVVPAQAAGVCEWMNGGYAAPGGASFYFQVQGTPLGVALGWLIWTDGSPSAYASFGGQIQFSVLTIQQVVINPDGSAHFYGTGMASNAGNGGSTIMNVPVRVDVTPTSDPTYPNNVTLTASMNGGTYSSGAIPTPKGAVNMIDSCG